MKRPIRSLLIVVCTATLCGPIAVAQVQMPHEDLPILLEIEWRRGNDLAWEYNGGALGVYDQKIAHATGFGRNVPDALKNAPGYYDGYHCLLIKKSTTLGREYFSDGHTG